MSYLLHQDTCSACMRHVRRVNNRFVQHGSGLHVSAVTVMGLELWVLRPRTPVRYLQTYGALMRQVVVLVVDEPIAHRAAVIGSRFALQGRRMPTVALLIAATALVHGLTLVTHTAQLFANIPGLTVVDWTVP
jgi:tRNA(fMet)-specific endonuclease VapC